MEILASLAILVIDTEIGRFAAPENLTTTSKKKCAQFLACLATECAEHAMGSSVSTQSSAANDALFS